MLCTEQNRGCCTGNDPCSSPCRLCFVRLYLCTVEGGGVSLVVNKTHKVCQRPPNGNGPPDADNADAADAGKQIGQRYAGAQRDDGQHDAHPRLCKGAVQAVQQNRQPMPQ